MLWILAALAAPALWAATNVIDEELIHHRLKDGIVLTAITGLFAGIPGVALAVLGKIHGLSQVEFFLAALVGVVSLAAYVPYYWALKYDDAADVIIFWNLTPVIVALLAAVYADEHLGVLSWIAIGCLVLGSIVAKGRTAGKRSSSSHAYALMAISSLMVAIEVTLAKLLFQQATFGAIFGVICLTKMAIAVVVLAVRAGYLRAKLGQHEVLALGANETLDALASTLKSFALSIGPAGVVQALEGAQPLFVVVLEACGFDGVRIVRTHRQIIRLVAATALVVVGLTLVAYSESSLS